MSEEYSLSDIEKLALNSPEWRRIKSNGTLYLETEIKLTDSLYPRLEIKIGQETAKRKRMVFFQEELEIYTLRYRKYNDISERMLGSNSAPQYSLEVKRGKKLKGDYAVFRIFDQVRSRLIK